MMRNINDKEWRTINVNRNHEIIYPQKVCHLGHKILESCRAENFTYYEVEQLSNYIGDSIIDAYFRCRMALDNTVVPLWEPEQQGETISFISTKG